MNPLCCIAPVSIDDRTNPVIAKPAPPNQQHSHLSGLVAPSSNHASKPSFSTQASWISQDQLERLSSEDVDLEGKDSSSKGGFFFGNGVVGGGVAGIMYKWVNYGKGWRARWFELEDGVLSYYKIHGPDKIVMNPAREKGGVRVIGEESVRYIRKASCGGSSSNKLGAGAGASSRPCKPFGEVHLKVTILILDLCMKTL